MSDTAFAADLLPSQNDPLTNVRTATVTLPGNRPPDQVKRAVLIFANATLAAAGIVTVMLGGACAIPLYVPAGGLGGSMVIYAGDGGAEFLTLGDFSLSQPLAGGYIALLTVQ